MKTKLLILLRVFGFLLIYIFVFGSFQLLAAWLTGMGFSDESAMTEIQLLATNIAGFIATLLVLYVFTRWVDKIPFVDIGLQTNRFNDFFKGLLFGFVPIALGFISLYALGLIKDIQVRADGFKLLLTFLAFVLVAFNEEAFMRGYVLRNLMLISNKYIALIISALLFALLHIANDHINLIGLTNIFLAGILLGLSYIYTKNLWFPIGLHLAWNFSQSLFGFNVSGNSTYSLINYQLTGEMPWLTGGKFGFEASVLSLVFELILIIAIYFLFKNQKPVQ